jgi:hypothetical protein
MSEITLTKTRLFEGFWEGVLTRSSDGNFQPALSVTHLTTPIEGVEVIEDANKGSWVVRVPIPAALIADGMQTFLIADSRSGETLASFSLLAGEALAEDVRAEMDLLRAELDMLKRAFRRHCVETT